MAEDGSEALALAQEQHPDLIILDIMMPKVNGFDCCTALREMGVEAPIIFLTAKGDIVTRASASKAGADDYLVKPFIPQELLLRIEALLRRSKAASQDQGTQKGNMPERLEFPGLAIDAKTRKVHVRGQAVDLTPKEFHLLYMLACNAGRVFTRSQIIEDVWGRRVFREHPERHGAGAAHPHEDRAGSLEPPLPPDRLARGLLLPGRRRIGAAGTPVWLAPRKNGRGRAKAAPALRGASRRRAGRDRLRWARGAVRRRPPAWRRNEAGWKIRPPRLFPLPYRRCSCLSFNRRFKAFR